MLSFPRRRRGKDNRQLYLVPDITSFILVYQRDDHIFIIPIWLCIVPPPKAGEQYERTAILYHQQYTSKLGDVNNMLNFRTFKKTLFTPLTNTDLYGNI